MEVRLERAAVEGLSELDTGDARQVRKKLGKLGDAPELGAPLGNKGGFDLTGYRKLVLCNRRVRVIYGVETEFVRVVVIGQREDMKVYREAIEAIRSMDAYSGDA